MSSDFLKGVIVGSAIFAALAILLLPPVITRSAVEMIDACQKEQQP